MKNLIKKALTGIMLFSPVLAFGQTSWPGVKSEVSTVNKVADIQRVISYIVNWITGLFFVVAVLYIFYAAFLFLTSGGDEEKIKTAKNQLLYAVIAIAVALLAGTMQSIVKSILNA